MVPLPDGIGFYRYQGFSLEEKIGWMRQGAGSGALAEARAALAALGGDLVQSEQNLRDLVNRLGGAWEGAAGTEAGEAMRLAATWSADSAPAADEAWSRVDLQSESVDRTRYGMPGSAPRPEYGFGDALGDAFNAQTYNLFDVQTSYDEQVAARRAADEEANRLLYAHEAASRANLAALPALPPVPSITVDTAPPATDCLPVVPEQDTVTPPRLHELTEEHREVRDQRDQAEKDTKDDKDRDTDDRPGQVDPRPESRTTGQDPRTQLDQSTTDPRAQEPPQSKQTPQAPQTPQLPLTDVPGPRPGESVSAAGYVPEPQTGQSLPGAAGGSGGYRAGAPGPTAGFGPLGGGVFTGGGTDTPRPPLGGGPVSGAAPAVRGGPAGVPARGGVAGAGRGSSGLFGHPGAHADGEEDAEHSDKYFRGTDELFRVDDIPALGYSVLGAEAEER